MANHHVIQKKKSKEKRSVAPVPVALAAIFLIASGAVHAQDNTLPAITVSDQNAPKQADVTGFGDTPLREVPMSATVVDSQQIQGSGARRLADLTQFDSSVTDAYNAAGYIDYLTVRGFVIDNRFNYRREGLPINAETSIPLDNKERVEILRGTSGIQAGTSAPGGLVNYVVKRPTSQDLREVRIETSSGGGLLGAVDLGGRFGDDKQFGYRLNVANENIKPLIHNLDGNRNLFSLATDWRITRDSLLEFEIEQSHKTQPSQGGYSLLGNVLPAPPNPRINLNNQPWSQPSTFDAITGTLRFTQALNDNWRWSAQYGRQSLKTNDREAFAFGCSAEGNYDRFCSDGTYDLYDFRSENERRRQVAGKLDLTGKLMTGSVRHDLSFALLQSTVHNRFQDEAYNYVGTGNVWGTAFTPPDPSQTTPQTNLDERSTELSFQDAIHWNDRFTTWLGVRDTSLNRSSISTEGADPTAYRQHLTTPWLAASYKLKPGLTAYTSYGKGVESAVVPNLPQYTNAGQALPALTSRQWEIGLKGGDETLNWQVAYFDISRPVTNLDDCQVSGAACTGQYDGRAVHRGLEANAQWSAGPWRLGGGVTLLNARRLDSSLDPADNGQHPTNVPNAVVRARLGYQVASVPGLELQAHLSYEGRRNILGDGSIQLPSWTVLGAALNYDTRINGVNTRWTLGVENLFDRRYWKESPNQYGQVYLFPGAPRTVRLAVTASL